MVQEALVYLKKLQEEISEKENLKIFFNKNFRKYGHDISQDAKRALQDANSISVICQYYKCKTLERKGKRIKSNFQNVSQDAKRALRDTRRGIRDVGVLKLGFKTQLKLCAFSRA